MERKPETSGSLTICGNGRDADDNSTDFVSRSTSEPQNTSSTPEACADLFVSKTGGPNPVAVGATLTYAVTVNNLGPHAADNVVATESLPPGVTFLSTSGCNNDPAGVPACGLGTIPPGGSKAYTIAVTVNQCQGTVHTNAVTAASGTTDPNTTDNSDTETTSVSDPTACDDGDACTTSDACSGATCVGVPCEDGDPCTVNSCDPGTGCFFTFQDADGDGICDSLDCAPLDPTNSPPPVVGPTVTWNAGSKTDFSWAAVPGASSYPVYHGTLARPWTYNQTCLENSADTSSTEIAIPSPGQALYELIAARNGCGDSGLGSGSAGPRPTPTTCP
jgi:uncharacterized repeat protein (TIGR01451 family)